MFVVYLYRSHVEVFLRSFQAFLLCPQVSCIAYIHRVDHDLAESFLLSTSDALAVVFSKASGPRGRRTEAGWRSSLQIFVTQISFGEAFQTVEIKDVRD